MPLQRIAVIGAECTGKTWLCSALAERNRGLWVPETLRDFVDRAGRAPRQHEQAVLMHEQIEREDAALARAAAGDHALVAFDSAPLVTALYSRLYFDDDSLLADAVEHHVARYDATLLTATDLPWEPDGLQRDGPELRERFHGLLLACLNERKIPNALVQGAGAARLASAQRALDRLHLAPR
jgi:nicotinamide riboside kinase